MPTIGSIASALGDPIFAAIERHKAAYEARDATRFAMDDVINTREASQAEWDAYERAHENEDAAFNDLLTNAPETSAGTRAIIAHLISLDDGRLSQKMKRLLTLLLKSRLLESDSKLATRARAFGEAE
jgi:capsular polysaccharide biosynthesis protein